MKNKGTARQNHNIGIFATAALMVLFGVSCIRRAPAGLLDPRTAPSSTVTNTMVPFTNTFTSTAVPTNTFTAVPTNTFTVVPTNTFTSVPPTNTFTAVFTNSFTSTPPPGATDTFTPTPVPPTNTFTPTPVPPTNTFSPTPVPPTSTFTPTPAAGLPYIIRGEAAFNWVVSPASWATMNYPASEMTRGAPPYTSWTAPTASDAVMYGGYNSVAGTGPTWCTPLTTYTTFQVNQETGDMYAGTGSLRFSGQQGGYTWGGWTYWGLTINGSWSTVALDPFTTGLEFWAKDLVPSGNASTIRIGPRGTDIDDGTGNTAWATDQALSPSWTQHVHPFLAMDSGWPNFTPITNFTATGPTVYAGLSGGGAGAACTWAYLIDELKLY